MKLTVEQKELIKAREERNKKWLEEYDKSIKDGTRDDEKWSSGEQFLTACCKSFFEFPGLPENSYCSHCYKKSEPLDSGDPIWQELVEEVFLDDDGEWIDNPDYSKARRKMNPDGILSLEQVAQLPDDYSGEVKGWEDYNNKIEKPKRKTLEDVKKRLKKPI